MNGHNSESLSASGKNGLTEYALSYSPNEASVSLWNLHTQSEIRTFKFPGSITTFSGVTLINNTHFLLTDSKSNSSSVYWLGSSEFVSRSGFAARCSHVVSLPDSTLLLAAGIASGNILLHDLTSGFLLKIIEAHYRGVSALSASPCGRFVASASFDGSVHVYTVSDLANLTTFVGKANNMISSDLSEVPPYFKASDHAMPVTDLCFDPRSQLLATAGEDRTVCLYNVRERTRIRLIPLAAPASKIVFDPSGAFLVVGTVTGAVYLYTLAQISLSHTTLTAPLKTLIGHEGIVTGLQFLLESSTLISSAKDGLILSWDLQSGTQLATLGKHHKVPGSSVEFVHLINKTELAPWGDQHRKFYPFSKVVTPISKLHTYIAAGPSDSPALELLDQL